MNPCDLKWCYNRGKGADLTVVGVPFGWCGCGFVVGMLERMGEILLVCVG